MNLTLFWNVNYIKIYATNIYIKYFWNRPNIPTFIELLQSEKKKTNTNLLVYIYKSFKKQKEFLYLGYVFSSLLFLNI